jgi:hypothetical protein
MDKTSNITSANPKVFNGLDYPYLASLMERMAPDTGSNSQKM